MIIVTAIFIMLSIIALIYAACSLYIFCKRDNIVKRKAEELSEAEPGISSSIGGVGRSIGGPRSISS